MDNRNDRNASLAVSRSDAGGCNNGEEEMARPSQPQNEGVSGSSAGSGLLSESTIQPAPIPNKMKFVLKTGLRESLGNYKTRD